MVRTSNILSVYQEARSEAQRFKWIESERARCDLGESAVERWARDHWSQYVRERWLEHVQGIRFWQELERGNDFGLVQSELKDEPLLEPILERLKDGHENLDVILWAIDHRLPLDQVLYILESLDINGHRLEPDFFA